MSSNQIAHISEFVKTMAFGPVETDPKDEKKRQKVSVFQNALSTNNSNKIHRANLCVDAREPLPCRYSLDVPHADANPDRRGLLLKVTDPVTAQALHAIDESVITKAIECSKEWFKVKGPPLSEEVIRSKYIPLIYRKDASDAFECCRVKVKTGGAVPTTLHLVDEDGSYRKNAGKREHITETARVVPIVSLSYGIWFAGGNFGLSLQAEEMMIYAGEAKSDDLSHFATSVPLKKAREVREEPALETGEVSPPKAVEVELLGGGDTTVVDGEEKGPM